MGFIQQTAHGRCPGAGGIGRGPGQSMEEAWVELAGFIAGLWRGAAAVCAGVGKMGVRGTEGKTIRS